MASMSFSATFSTPLQSFSQAKAKISSNSSASCPSMACWIKSSLGSSKSALFRNGLSLQSENFNGVLIKSRSLGVYARAATERSLYDFTVKDIDGKDVPLSKFKGKVLLIVNVASRCGLTSSNYSELSHLYEKYKPQGFEILAFPCNQFGGQEPGSNGEIKQFACTRFKAEFPIFDKVDVNGPSTAPVYQFLKSSAGGFLGDIIKWNFEKFLVDKNGKVVERYPPTTSPFQIELERKSCTTCTAATSKEKMECIWKSLSFLFEHCLSPSWNESCLLHAAHKTTTSNRNVDDQDDHHHPNPTNPIVQILQQPIQWLRMLSSELNPTFVLGVVLVYGLSQGFSGSYFKVVTDYYWKDVQKLQPSVVQLYIGLYYIPWLMKPVWGLLTDVFPVRGYRRRPYFVLAGVIGTLSALTVAFSGNLAAVVALTWLIGVTAGVAIADVTIDACIARNSIEIRSLASDLQSLCGFCSSAGALVGYSTSGFFVHHLGPQGALGLLAIPPIFLTVLGFVIYEQRSTNLHSQRKKVRNLNLPLLTDFASCRSYGQCMAVDRCKNRLTSVLEKLEFDHVKVQMCSCLQAAEEVGVAMSGIYKTIKLPQVWKPSLYMYLSLALSINTQEGNFYWYTDPSAGPAFSQEFVGMIYAVGAVASIVGVLIYHKTLKNYPFRNLVFFAQLLYAISGLLDLTFILRWNLALGIPDYFFVIMEECVFRIVTKIRWMPMIVLSTKLCPLGIEGTFFALLMCIDSLGSLSSKWGGGAVLHALSVTRTNFTNLWLALLIRNVLRFLTLGLIFLVPKADQLDLLIPSDLLTKNSSEFSDVDDQSLELVPSKGKIEANKHTIILMQTSHNKASRTFMDYDSISQAMDGMFYLWLLL
ncbi:unnamed protein product [Malus baccata var. baccata]